MRAATDLEELADRTDECLGELDQVLELTRNEAFAVNPLVQADGASLYRRLSADLRQLRGFSRSIQDRATEMDLSL